MNYIVVGLGYGDEGKGLVVDHLVREHNALGVIRFNGGAQAAHNVVLPDDRHHTFSQFSAGTLAGARTYLSEYSLVNPSALFTEGTLLKEILGRHPYDKIAVHGNALITTPLHMAANRLREFLRGSWKHGSCGMGIGETVALAKEGLALHARDLHSRDRTRRILGDIQDHYRAEFTAKVIAKGMNSHHLATDLFSMQTMTDTAYVYSVFAKAVPQFDGWNLDPEDVYILEGAQGALLDEYHGFHPHTTWSKTTSENALKISPKATIIGVTRSYMTRHGAGPFFTEDPSLLSRFPEEHNISTGVQGAWRVGWTDLAALKYALEFCDVDELAVTHLDHVRGDWKVNVNERAYMAPPRPRMPRKDWEWERAYQLRKFKHAEPDYIEFEDIKPANLLGLIEGATDMNVTIEAYGPTHEDVKSESKVA